MRRNKLIILLFIVYSCTILTSKAQTNFKHGFIITNAGDSIKGFIDSRGAVRSSSICTFKLDKESEPIQYKPDQIIAYGITNGSFYVSKDVVLDKDTVKVFLDYLIDGVVDIYYYRGLGQEAYFIKKDQDSKLTLVTNANKYDYINGVKKVSEKKSYVGVLKYIFDQSPEIQKKVETFELSRRNLLKLAQDYHEQISNGDTCIVYARRKYKPRYGIEAILGFDYHSLNVSKEYYFKSSVNYSFGINGYMTVPRINENVTLNLQIRYGSYELFDTKKNKYFRTTQGANLINTIYLSYIYPKGKIRPVFLGGLSYNHAFINDVQETYYINSVGVITTSYRDVDILNKGYIGILLGVGMDIPINNRYELTLKLQYNYFENIDLVFIEYSYNPISLILGFKI